MKRISYLGTALALALCSSIASADPQTCPGSTPNPNAAIIGARVFDDCPITTLTVTNNYPSSIVLDDQHDQCFGGANLDVWTFSDDGGATRAKFENCSAYHFCADVTLSGTNPGGEGGLRLSPWWSPEVDGRFMINAGSGEIACFGGRLPFYSFTRAYGITYVKGTTVKMEITYQPNGLSAFHPATIVYKITIGPNSYSSPAIPYDEGNAGEGAVHGTWGELYEAYPGGYVQQPGGNGNDVGLTATWANICFETLVPTATTRQSWGTLKQHYR